MVAAHWFTYGGTFIGDGSDLPTDLPPVPKTYMLDEITNTAYQAYSMRRVAAAYDGPALTVRRSSDSTTLDVGFGSDDLLDEAALLAFAGAGDAFVATWYDQSGNNRHMVSPSNAQQPPIVQAGVVHTILGRPALLFAGTADRHLRHSQPGSAGLIAAGGLSIAEVHDDQNTTVSYGESDSTSGGGRLIPFFWSSATPPLMNSLYTNDAGATQNTGGAHAADTVGSAHADVFIKPGLTGAKRYRDGALTATSNTLTVTLPTGVNAASLGGWPSAPTAVSSDYKGSIAEHVMFAGEMNETAIGVLHGSQSAYFALG